MFDGSRILDAHTHTLHVSDLHQALIFGVTTVLDKVVYDNRAHITGEPEPTLRKETLAAVIEAAHQRGKQTVVHVLKLQDACDAIEVGADGLAHLFVDLQSDATFVQRAAASHAFAIPTLSVLEYISDQLSCSLSLPVVSQ